MGLRVYVQRGSGVRQFCTRKVSMIYSCRCRSCRLLRQLRLRVDGGLDEVGGEPPQEVDDDGGAASADGVSAGRVHGVVGHDDLRVGAGILCILGVLPLSLQLEAAES